MWRVAFRYEGRVEGQLGGMVVPKDRNGVTEGLYIDSENLWFILVYCKYTVIGFHSLSL